MPSEQPEAEINGLCLTEDQRRPFLEYCWNRSTWDCRTTAPTIRQTKWIAGYHLTKTHIRFYAKALEEQQRQ